jgi:hypothetical protein
MECDRQSGMRTPATHCLDGSVTAVLSADRKFLPVTPPRKIVK